MNTYTAASRRAMSWASDILLIRDLMPLLTRPGRAHYRRCLITSAALGIAEGTALFAIMPTLVAFTTDTPSMGLSWRSWCVVFLILAATSAGLTFVKQRSAYMAGLDLLSTMDLTIGDAVTHRPLGWFTAGTGAHLSRLLTHSLMMAGQGAAHFVSPVIQGATTTLTLIVFVSAWSWPLGLVFAAAIPVVLGAGVLARWCKRRGELIMSGPEKELSRVLVEFSTTQPSLRAAGRCLGYSPLRQAQEASDRAARRDLTWAITGSVIGGIAGQAVCVALIILAAHAALEGSVSIWFAVALMGVILRYCTLLETLSINLMAIEAARVPLAEVTQVCHGPVLPEPDEPLDASAWKAPGAITLDDVCFSYTPGQPVLQHISCDIPAGSLTAIVGPSGSGKSTILRLLARFWDVDSGSVSVGGVDVRKQTVAEHMAQIAMVFQKVYLYDSTLEDNIRVGCPTASQEQVRAAGQMAGVDEIADRLPGGWAARVGEGGGRLSGGERQRVSVARALLKNAPIVLLDEATSALDPDNEAHIADVVNCLRGKHTVVVVAHRLETIRSADQILVLTQDGRLEATGSHESLLTSCTTYRSFWRSRQRAQGWSLTG